MKQQIAVKVKNLAEENLYIHLAYMGKSGDITNTFDKVDLLDVERKMEEL